MDLKPLGSTEAWFEEARGQIRPNVAMYNAMLSATGLSEAEKWLKQMEFDGVLPDARTFGILIASAVRMGDLLAADRWLQRAERAGGREQRLR